MNIVFYISMLQIVTLIVSSFMFAQLEHFRPSNNIYTMQYQRNSEKKASERKLQLPYFLSMHFTYHLMQRGAKKNLTNSHNLTL